MSPAPLTLRPIAVNDVEKPRQVPLTGPTRGDLRGQCRSAFSIGHPLTRVSLRRHTGLAGRRQRVSTK